MAQDSIAGTGSGCDMVKVKITNRRFGVAWALYIGKLVT